jgi:hypothetical protein
MKILRTLSVTAIGTAVALFGAACSKPDGAAPSSGAAPAATSAQAATKPAPAAATTKDVSLAPLPLKLVMPASESAVTMDKSMGGKKSVGVSYDEIFSGINVSEPSEKNFDEVKKRQKADAVFPFKRWVQESATSAVEEFTDSGKTGYIAWAWKEVGGKPYLCQSTGLSGVKTPEDAAKVLKICDTLAAN